VGFATPICFEDADGPLCREMIYGASPATRAQVLANVTNDGWFAGSAQPWQHLQLATLRCIENRVPMARSVNTGVSGFIDSLGRVQQLATQNGQATQTTAIATHTLRLDDRRTAYSQYGRVPVLALVGLTVLLLLGCLLSRDKITSPAH
jgi:apolipoprotein N-acyltransferase